MSLRHYRPAPVIAWLLHPHDERSTGATRPSEKTSHFIWEGAIPAYGRWHVDYRWPNRPWREIAKESTELFLLLLEDCGQGKKYHKAIVLQLSCNTFVNLHLALHARPLRPASAACYTYKQKLCMPEGSSQVPSCKLSHLPLCWKVLIKQKLDLSLI